MGMEYYLEYYFGDDSDDPNGEETTDRKIAKEMALFAGDLYRVCKKNRAKKTKQQLMLLYI